MSEPNDKLNTEGFDPTTKLPGTNPQSGQGVDGRDLPGEEEDGAEEEDGGVEI